ncbi:hypothetical protein C8R43DRAFT_1235300 [Mycena crocata]|nr:hypothetical protein C8R43DRAFT_1235300 [Mycena crocata]
MSIPAQPRPRLPVELEREIFELSAHTHPVGVPTLLLVARRVKIWLEPILYRTLIVCERRGFYLESPPMITLRKLVELVDSRPATFFHEHVRNLYCDTMPGYSTTVILRKCSGTQNLYLSTASVAEYLSELAEMPLRRLAIWLREDLFESSYSTRALSSITHLHLHDNWMYFTADDHKQFAGLATIPCITHLSFSELGCQYPALFAYALEHCPHLKVLVLVCSELEDLDGELDTTFAHDSRFVQLLVDDYRGDWEKGALGGEDYWSRADVIVRERQLRKSTAQSE